MAEAVTVSYRQRVCSCPIACFFFNAQLQPHRWWYACAMLGDVLTLSFCSNQPPILLSRPILKSISDHILPSLTVLLWLTSVYKMKIKYLPLGFFRFWA